MSAAVPSVSSIAPRAIHAFTLLELLVVVVLLGVAATVVAVRASGASEAALLRSATAEFQNTWTAAQRQALRRHRVVTLELLLGESGYRNVDDRRADVPWRIVRGVRFSAFRWLGAAQPQRTGPVAIRLTPTGAALPWALEFSAGGSRRAVLSDGFCSLLSVGDGSELEALHGPRPTEQSRP